MWASVTTLVTELANAVAASKNNDIRKQKTDINRTK
jgi:hypothetical protein